MDCSVGMDFPERKFLDSASRGVRGMSGGRGITSISTVWMFRVSQADTDFLADVETVEGIERVTRSADPANTFARSRRTPPESLQEKHSSTRS